ncbi:MAG: DNA alkylation repair protein [Hyphomicrobiaceae bacterium]
MSTNSLSMTPREFVAAIEAALAALADPAKALAMARYMKNNFAFLGIKTPDRRAATRTLIRAQDEHVVDVAEALWNLPYREYQYVACDLLERRASGLPASALPRVMKLVTCRSWWDTVDALAKVAGTIVRNHSKHASRMDRLAMDKNMWLRRIAILHQLGVKDEMDTDRLFRICLVNAGDPEFFVRKAIGWALRDYAHHDPDAVRRFLDAHRGRFSALTVREASKHL